MWLQSGVRVALDFHTCLFVQKKYMLVKAWYKSWTERSMYMTLITALKYKTKIENTVDAYK